MNLLVDVLSPILRIVSTTTLALSPVPDDPCTHARRSFADALELDFPASSLRDSVREFSTCNAPPDRILMGEASLVLAQNTGQPGDYVQAWRSFQRLDPADPVSVGMKSYLEGRWMREAPRAAYVQLLAEPGADPSTLCPSSSAAPTTDKATDCVTTQRVASVRRLSQAEPQLVQAGADGYATHARFLRLRESYFLVPYGHENEALEPLLTMRSELVARKTLDPLARGTQIRLTAFLDGKLPPVHAQACGTAQVHPCLTLARAELHRYRAELAPVPGLLHSLGADIERRLSYFQVFDNVTDEAAFRSGIIYMRSRVESAESALRKVQTEDQKQALYEEILDWNAWLATALLFSPCLGDRRVAELQFNACALTRSSMEFRTETEALNAIIKGLTVGQWHSAFPNLALRQSALLATTYARLSVSASLETSAAYRQRALDVIQQYITRYGDPSTLEHYAYVMDDTSPQIDTSYLVVLEKVRWELAAPGSPERERLAESYARYYAIKHDAIKGVKRPWMRTLPTTLKASPNDFQEPVP